MGGPTTVFVRNLPYTCTDAGLEEAFGEIGPVKEAFIVAEKGTGGASKGFGFVQFALAEDAAAAVAKSKTHKVDGRPVTIDIAKQKPSAKGAGKAPDTKTGGGGGGEDDARPAADDGDESDSDAPKTKAADVSRPKGPPAGSSGSGAPSGAQRGRRKRGADDDADAVHPALAPKRAARSVAIAGLRLAGEPDGIDPEAALDAARACGGVEEVLSPAPKIVVDHAKLRHDGAARGVIVVVYTSEAVAQCAVTALHRAMPGVGKRKQQKVKAKLKEGGVDTNGVGQTAGGVGVGPDASASVLWARALGGCEGAKPKSWRVIIRNLAFKATDDDIRTACSKAGFVWDLTVPRDFHRKPKGFAFAAYTSKKDAERAVKEVNGSQIAGRPVAVDWALSKHTYAEAKAKAEAAAEAEAENAEESGSESGSDSGSDEESGSWEQSGSGEQSGSDESDDESDEDASSDVFSDSASESAGADEINTDPPIGDVDMMHRVMMRVMDHPDASENPAETREADEKRGRSRREQREAAREARVKEKQDASEAKESEKAAKAKKALQTSDGSDSDDDTPNPLPGHQKRNTPPSDGASVFLRDVPTEATKQEVYDRMRKFGAVRSCRLVMDKATGRPKGTAFVDFHEPKGAEAAVQVAEKDEGGGVKIAGRRLSIALAVSASEAADLATARSKENATGGKHRDGPRDNRNLYLASEGQIHEEGPAARGVSQSDIQKRRRAKEEQNLKLKNPNFFISKTRLQVRNVPVDVDQKQLKKVFFDAVKQRATQQNPRVLHAKLLLDASRPDENGNPRSRGIGFVEFDEHEHALAALRALNNNPTTFGSQRRPIVEFAVEDARAVRKLERRRDALDKAQKERNEANALANPGGTRNDSNNTSGDKKKTRGQKRREREKEGETGAVKKPWGNKKKKAGDEESTGGAKEGAKTQELAKNEKAEPKPKPVNPKKTEKKKRRRDESSTPSQNGASFEKSRRGRDEPVGRSKKGERRDKTDDLVDRYVAKGSAKDGAGKSGGEKKPGRWFDY